MEKRGKIEFFLLPFLLNFLIWWTGISKLFWYTYLLCYCTIFSICRDAVWFSKMKFSFKLTQIFIPKNTLLLVYISRIWRFKRLLCDLLLSIRRFHRRKIDWLMYCILVLVVWYFCILFVDFFGQKIQQQVKRVLFCSTFFHLMM